MLHAEHLSHYFGNRRRKKLINFAIMEEARRFVFVKRFNGMPKVTDFRLEEVALPFLKDGDVLAEAVYLSVDPYMGFFSENYPLAMTMMGGQVARVTDSKNPTFPKGSFIYGTLGWRTHTVFNPDDENDNFLMRPYVLQSFDDLPLSFGLGLLGVPGNTAYFGFLDICKPKKGETVVVSEAADAVGHIVGQIAKIKGCNVIGIVDSDEKRNWLTKDLGFDHAINYKTESVALVLKQYARKGVDCYFDNVGGELSSIVISQMKEYGRISVCGSISSFNLANNELPKATNLQPTFFMKKLKMEGFFVNHHWDKWFDGINQLKQWTEDGKIKYRETTTNGFENMPQAFIDMLDGKHIGKTIIKI